MLARFSTVVILLFTAHPTFAQSVPPEIASKCAEDWGTDYRMQAFCQKEQMEAYVELGYASAAPSVDATLVQGIEAAVRVSQKSGESGLNRAIDKCYRTVNNFDNLKYCVALDFTALRNVPKGRNSPRSTVIRVVTNIENNSYLGTGNFKNSWLDDMKRASDHILGR